MNAADQRDELVYEPLTNERLAVVLSDFIRSYRQQNQSVIDYDGSTQTEDAAGIS